LVHEANVEWHFGFRGSRRIEVFLVEQVERLGAAVRQLAQLAGHVDVITVEVGLLFVDRREAGPSGLEGFRHVRIGGQIAEPRRGPTPHRAGVIRRQLEHDLDVVAIVLQQPAAAGIVVKGHPHFVRRQRCCSLGFHQRVDGRIVGKCPEADLVVKRDQPRHCRIGVLRPGGGHRGGRG
jgi:hypothetical protein